MITLQDITSTSFYVVIESVARLLGVQNPLKSIKLHHGEMTFLCKICGAKFPFASVLSNYQALHSQEKKIVCPYPKYGRKYKTKPELNCHITTDTDKNHPRQPLINVLFVTKHFKEPNI